MRSGFTRKKKNKYYADVKKYEKKTGNYVPSLSI
jgi:hypothetical protein